MQRVYGAEVTGYGRHGGMIKSVSTDQGEIRVDDAVVVAAGSWMPKHWSWLSHEARRKVTFPDSHVEADMDMWTYWRLLEGEVYLPDGIDFRTADGKDSPVFHVELMGTPVQGEDGRELKDHVYFYTRYAAERMGLRSARRHHPDQARARGRA